MNERAAANRAKIASGNKAANPASGSQPKVDPTRKENAKHVCATCGGSEQLEADCDAVGVFYCRSCWESYEQGR
jgi:late competence protein required for DNA uptake (superfamily II DNA/RNA helicase)